MEVAILLRESAVAKSTPGAIGSRETRSGEFCRGMMLFMSYFSRSAQRVWIQLFWPEAADPAMTINRSARILLFAYHALLRVKPNT
ncbi:hypothetical protein RF971_002533 [Escherichia coli]|nr:hypothetical protein [Escherichia coli]